MLLDTSYIVDLISGRPDALALASSLDAQGQSIRIPSPAAFELWVGGNRSLQGSDDLRRLEIFLTAYEVVPFDGLDARCAGELQGTMLAGGKPLGTVDAQVAGMCLARGETLVTSDLSLVALKRGLRVLTYRRK